MSHILYGTYRRKHKKMPQMSQEMHSATFIIKWECNVCQIHMEMHFPEQIQSENACNSNSWLAVWIVARLSKWIVWILADGQQGAQRLLSIYRDSIMRGSTHSHVSSQEREIWFQSVYRQHILIPCVNPSQPYPGTSEHKILVIAWAKESQSCPIVTARYGCGQTVWHPATIYKWAMYCKQEVLEINAGSRVDSYKACITFILGQENNVKWAHN